MMRTTSTALGLAAGIAVFTVAHPASAVHIRLDARGPDATASVVEPVPPVPAILALGEPMNLFGEVKAEDLGGGTFTHRYNFGVDLPAGVDGIGGASATPNILEFAGNVTAGFEGFRGTVNWTGDPADDPLPPGGVELVRDETPVVPREQTIVASFAAIDTEGETPYRLTIAGELLSEESVLIGNYTGNMAVVPLPGAALLFLTGLGGLFFARHHWQRQREAAATD